MHAIRLIHGMQIRHRAYYKWIKVNAHTVMFVDN